MVDDALYFPGEKEFLVPTLTMSALAAAPLSARDRHFVNRFSFGHTPQLAAQVRAAGGGRAWFEKQLSPSKINDAGGAKVKDWYPNLWYSPLEIWNRNTSGDAPAYIVMKDLAMWTVMRRVNSSRQVHEVMVDFWSNLLHVPLGDDLAWPYRVSYDKMMRDHALGNFADMLVDAITHPSMGLYLDNAFSTKYSPNENLGRELLELHSVGVEAGYTEAHVQDSARMLTGYRVDIYAPDPNGVRAYYNPEDHDTTTIKVLGFKATNANPDGRKATEKYIRYLANHPATAKRIAKRLCVKFVSDKPSSGLVKAVQTAFTKSGTDVKATLRALVSHPEFASAGGDKVRMPLDDTVAAIRGLGIAPRKPVSDSSFASSLYWRLYEQGQTPYGWPTPDGFPEENGVWSSPGRALDSFSAQLALVEQWSDTDVKYPGYESWLPKLPMKFGSVIDHICVRALGEPASDRLKDGISIRSGVALGKNMAAADMTENRVRQVLLALLGSPTHMTR